jgi:ABC-type transport system involved in multi-copper enzyme maturation permease subunit
MAETRRLLQHFMEAEWLKLRHSRMFKATVATMALTPVAALLSLTWLEGSSIVFLRVLELIGSFLLVLGTVNALLLTAIVLGDEFEQGMDRVIVERGIPRWMLVVGKGGILIGATTLSVLAGWFCSSIAAVVSHVSQAGTKILLLGILALCTSGLDAIVVVLLAASAYVGLTMAIGVLTRSTAFTMFGGLGLFLGDLLVNGDLGLEFELGQWSAFSIFHNAGTLLSKLQFAMAPQALTAGGGLGTSSTCAILVLLCYALGGLVVAILLFQRQDL